MRLLGIVGALVAWFAVAEAQPSNLAEEHSLLVKDCKNIRGHAGRVVEEASQSDLNRDVAHAHAEEVVKYLRQMEGRLATTKKMLKKEQLVRVTSHYKSLEQSCSKMQELSSKIEKELSKEKPDRLEVKKMATALRAEMSGGNDVHQKMMKALGLR